MSIEPFSVNIKLLLGDFREESHKIADSSIDLIFTDPPYKLQYLHYYKVLGKIAARVLKPGGSIFAMTGHYALPVVMDHFRAAGLKYWWILSVEHSGNHVFVYQRRLFVDWKPLLWYVKGDKSNHLDRIGDHIRSKKPEKALHELAQSTVEADHVIKRLTVENQIVLDLFMGSGTTGIAALKLKRKFIGIEVDDEKFAIAKKRFQNGST